MSSPRDYTPDERAARIAILHEALAWVHDRHAFWLRLVPVIPHALAKATQCDEDAMHVWAHGLGDGWPQEYRKGADAAFARAGTTAEKAYALARSHAAAEGGGAR